MYNSILKYPDYITIETEQESTTLECGKEEISQKDIKVKFVSTLNDLNIKVKANDSKIRFLKVRWNINIPNGIKVLSDEWERGYGDLEWRGLVANRYMPWYFMLTKNEESAGYGVKVRPGALCFWQLDSLGVTLHLDVRCGGIGVELKGRELQAATVVFSEYKNISAFEATKEFCKVMCSDPIFPDKPVYGSNNWYYAYGNSSHEEIIKDTKYLCELVGNVENRPYLVIDDGWQINHKTDYNGGPWNAGNSKFSDMAALGQEIKEQNIKAGIWVRFLLNCDDSIPKNWRMTRDSDYLDPSVPEVLEYIKQDIHRITNWGFSLIKHDFSTYDIFGKWGFQMTPYVTDGNWSFADTTKTSAEIIVNFYSAILESSEGAIILGCNTIGHLGAGLMHMNRTGDDISGLRWERTRRMGINTLAFRLPQHKTFYDVDADCVGINGNIPWEFNGQWTKLLAYSGTSLFVSARPGILNEAETLELKNALVVSSRQEDTMFPLDWFETNCPKLWSINGTVEEFQWYEKTGISGFGLEP